MNPENLEQKLSREKAETILDIFGEFSDLMAGDLEDQFDAALELGDKQDFRRRRKSRNQEKK